MQILGLLLLVASSWYIWKLTSNFLDEPTKKSISKDLQKINTTFKEIKKVFSKKFIQEAWNKYKEEDGVLANKKEN